MTDGSVKRNESMQACFAFVIYFEQCILVDDNMRNVPKCIKLTLSNTLPNYSFEWQGEGENGRNCTY